MNKGKQATLFQSWGQKKKDIRSDNKVISDIIDLCEGLDEDDDELLAEAMERSLHDYSDDGGHTVNGGHEGPSDVCNISIGTESFPVSTQGLTQRNVPPGFDRVAGKLWIYPTNYSVREYQYNIVGKALLKNTMVTLPTGLGKTFIAAVVMYNFYQWYPQGKVVFMAPTKPLVAQQIEACYNIMGIPQEDTAEMTGTMAPTERRRVWVEKRVFFLTPQVIMNDLSRGTCPAVDVRCLVIDEAHKATGNHAYCQVVRELIKYTTEFRVLALSATPGGDIKAVQQVLANLLISHIELRTEESPDIKPYSHERKVEKIVVPLGDELTSVKKKYVQILDVTVNKLKRHGVIYNRDTTSFSKFLILKAREDFRQNPPPNLQRNNYGMVEGDFALALSLYHGFELLQLHGSRSLFNYLDGILHGDKGYGRTKTELLRNPDFNDLMDLLREKFAPPDCRPSQSSKKPLVTGHPKMEKLEQVVLDHFNTFNSGDGETRVMIFSQYRDSVSEITNILKQHHPLVKVMSFIGQSSAGKSTKGFTQKEQLKVMKDFREGGYNTLVSTCVGEEGLDIGDVDLIVCFDAHKSPIRLVQRMGRTGRKREGRIVMLVTEGKEEQIYNQSQYSKKSIHKAILNSAKTLHFYQNNPAMVPDDWTPKCHKMFITVSKKFKPTKAASTSNMNKITSMLSSHDSKSNEDGGISKDEYEELKRFYDGELSGKTGKTLPEKSTMLSLGETNQTEIENNLSLSDWFPWQNRQQPTFVVDHSNLTKNFVEMVQFLELQEALDPNEDNYGQEMEVFLNEADILKPGQNDEDGGNIRQFFVANDTTIKHGKKKKSLYSQNKPRRSDQLPEFDAFVVSGESDDDLPAIFDKKDDKDDEHVAKNKADEITKAYRKSICIGANLNRSEKKNKQKKRNFSGNMSVVEVIADTDVNDFVETVPELTVINEESQGNRSNEVGNEFRDENSTHVQIDIEQATLSKMEASDYEKISETEAKSQDEYCEDFTKLLPTFFTMSVDIVSPQKITETNHEVFLVPEAPSIDELEVLVENINNLTTLPKIDMAQLVEEWTLVYSGLNTKYTSSTKKKNNKKVEYNKSSSICSDVCDDKTAGQDMGEKKHLDKDADAFSESFDLSNNVSYHQSNNGSYHQKQVANFDMDLSSDFDSPIQLLTNKPNKSKRTTTSLTVQNNTSTFDNVEHKISDYSTQSDMANNKKEVTELVEEPTHKLNEDGVEMEIDSFSGSDDFLDTQANFMLASDDFLGEINSDESNEGNKNKDSSLKLNKCVELCRESVSFIEKQRTGEAESSKSSSSNNKRINSCKSVDISLFDDSFMNESVLEAVKTPAVNEENMCQSDGRILSPSQYTFSQALAFVHDSDSMDISFNKTDLSGEREQSVTFKVPIEKEKVNLNVEILSKQKEKENFRNEESCFSDMSDHQKNIAADYSTETFTAIKSHDKLDTSQLNLINEIVNMDNTDDFSDDGDESDVPLFDLGFDVDDDIIPPSPCLSETTSQKSVLKNLGQSLLSSRKSLSFMCDKSRLAGQKTSTFLKPALSPTGEELELEQDDGDDFESSNTKVDEVSNCNKRTSSTFLRKEDTFNVNPVNFDAGDNAVTQKNEDENNVSLSDLHGDFDMPPSPVLSGRRLLSQKPVFSPVNLKMKSTDGLKSEFLAMNIPDQESPLKSKSPLINLSIQDSPSFDDSFVVRKKRKKTLIIDSPVTPDIRKKGDSDDFKTPLRPVSARVKKNISSTSSEEESILKKKKQKKAVSFCIDELLDDENDFEDIMSITNEKRNKSTNNETKTADSNKKDSYDNKKRKSKSPNPFLVDEAEVSEDEEASADEEEGSDLDHMEDSFVSEGCTQLSQGQHEELQAIYLKSVRSPAGQGGKFKLKYDYDDNIDVYSQVPQDEESQYYDDSFVCDEEEEHDLLEGHEITILDKGNIIDNESFVGPRTRWSKPGRHKVMPTVKTIKRKRVKRIADSSSEDGSDNQDMNLMSPAEPGRKFLDSPAMSQGHVTVSSRTSNRNSRQLLSSSDDEQDQKEGAISPEIMCSLKSRITSKQNLVAVTSIQQSASHKLEASADMTISKEKEERIKRQKEKQEEFRRHLIAKQQNNESVDKTNNYCDDTALLMRRNFTNTDENSHLTEDSDLLLNTTKPLNKKSVIIVDSREINGAQDIVSALRFNHNINVVAAQLDSCDYVVSVRMGVDRKQWSEFSNGANRAKMTERLLEMSDFYERPCLIIEKDKCKLEEKGRILHWTKYVDKTLVHLIQSKVTLFFTENQSETASIVADLCQLENRKNCAISCSINLNTEQQNKVKFYRSIPHLSYVHCLFLCNNYKTVASFLCSDVRTIMTNGKMTEERASNIYNYIRRKFDTQMLPSSYG